MTQKANRRLGRGLEALLGPNPTTADARADGTLAHLAVAAIQPNPYQPRHAFNQEALDELASSLATSGDRKSVV